MLASLTIRQYNTHMANQLPEQYFKAIVTQVKKETIAAEQGKQGFTQQLVVQAIDGPLKGKSFFVTNSGLVSTADSQRLEIGQALVLRQSTTNGKTTTAILDTYRLDTMLYLFIGFLLLVILIAGRRGVGAILGMGVSLAIILLFIVPQILQGADPLLISIVGSLAIMIITIYLAHGINRQTTVALTSTAVSLLLTGVIAVTFVNLVGLSGTASEEASFLQFGSLIINFKGLLLGGIIIGALGVLDDITTAQTAAVYEIARANTSLQPLDLIQRGYKIGKEHIASLVNTLVLAYAGASLSLFLLFVLNPADQPYWVILNNQVVLEEIVRTLSGSIGLILAVPITTVLAAYTVARINSKSQITKHK